MPGLASRISSEQILAGCLLFLCAGVFLGNAFIAIGQGLLILAIISAYIRRDQIRWDWKGLSLSSWFLIAATVVSFVSIIANLETISEPMQYVKKLRYPAFIIALLLLSKVREGEVLSLTKRNIYVSAWLAAIAISFVIGLVDFMNIGGSEGGGKFDGSERFSGLYGQVMTFAYILQFSVIALFVFLIRPKLFRRLTQVRWVIVIPVLIIALIGLYLSFTRGAVLGAIVGVGIAALFRSRWMLVPMAAAALIVGVFSYQQHTRYFEFGPVHRTAHWTGAALTFAKYPVFGVGYRNYEIRSAGLKKDFGLPPDQKFKRQKNAEDGYLKRHAHNNFLEAFASTGVFGGIAFLGFCFCWMREAWRSHYAMLFVPLIAAFLVSGFFENTFFDSEVLNCILLIYLFSQIVFDAEVAVDRKNQLSAGTTTTET